MKATNRMINLSNTHWVRPALIAGALAGFMALSALAGVMVLSGPPAEATAAVTKPAIDPQANEQLRTEMAERVQKLFNSDTFRVYTSHDPVGVEMGGALKNIYAIACGIPAAWAPW